MLGCTYARYFIHCSVVLFHQSVSIIQVATKSKFAMRKEDDEQLRCSCVSFNLYVKNTKLAVNWLRGVYHSWSLTFQRGK